MGNYPNVTEQDLINSAKLGEQQNFQRAIKFKNEVSKQPHDEKSIENYEPVTKKFKLLDKTVKKFYEKYLENQTLKMKHLLN